MLIKLQDSPVTLGDEVQRFEAHAIANAIKSWIRAQPQLALTEISSVKLNQLSAGMCRTPAIIMIA